jgi:hypothetical protein
METVNSDADLLSRYAAQVKIVTLYWRLLKGPSMSTMLPEILFDWKDVFRFAWAPRRLPESGMESRKSACR